METEKKSPVTRPIKYNDNLPTLYVDNVNIGRRKDGFFLLRFLVDLPEGKFEQARLFTDNTRLRIIIDAFCKSANYFPQQPVVAPSGQSPKTPT